MERAKQVNTVESVSYNLESNSSEKIGHIKCEIVRIQVNSGVGPACTAVSNLGNLRTSINPSLRRRPESSVFNKLLDSGIHPKGTLSLRSGAPE